MPESASLLGQGAAVVAAVESYLTRSEDRLLFRQQHNRALSKAHRDALSELAKELGALQGRLTAILEPTPDLEELRAQFEAACARLEGLI